MDKVSNLTKLETDQRSIEERVEPLQQKSQFLEQKCKSYEEAELVHAHRISLYEELVKMGMGIKELKLLRHTIAEIATANKIPLDKANQKFFFDVEEHYDYKLGFEAKLQNLKSEIEKNENVRLHAVNLTAMLNSPIQTQLEQIQNVSSFVEFGPLVKEGQNVPKSVEECYYQGHRRIDW